MWFLLCLHKTQDQGDSGRHCMALDQALGTGIWTVAGHMLLNK